MWSVLVLEAAAWLSLGAAFNVQPRGAVVFSPGDEATLQDHFGYTVSLARAQRKIWVMVSSPRAASRWEDSAITRPGALYRCWTVRDTGSPTCEQVRLVQGFSREKGPENTIHVSNGTLGSSMDALLNEDGLVVCNSAFKDHLHGRLDMPGKCFWLEDIPGSNPEKWRFDLRLDRGGMTKVTIKNVTYSDDIGTQMMGFSVHQLEKQRLLVGSPGYFWGRGAVAQMDSISDAELWGVAIPLLSNDSYLGYSVTSGKFLASGEPVFASGAPRGDIDDLKGRVVLFRFEENMRGIRPLNVLKVLSGSQIGEYFGASLCTVDLNNDGADDLLVGAPLHKSVIADEGKVYVFISNGKPEMMTEVESGLLGTKHLGGRFGTAISALGDINKDGYQDVAVGAPYEDGGRGAVYIYYGGRDAPHLLRPQRVTAAAVRSDLRGFGFSLSRGADVDENFYNDVAVGAYLSNHAVLLRTTPVLYLNSSIQVTGGKIHMEAKEVNISVCINPKQLLRDVGVQVTVNVDPVQNRASLEDGFKVFYYIQNMTKDTARNYCKVYKLVLKSSTRTFRPMDIELNFKIAYPVEGKSFCHTCPMLDPEMQTVTHRLYYETGCEGHVCKTNFLAKAEFEGIRSPFTIGNISDIEMNLEVINREENSFQTNISISFPSLVPLRQIDSSCHKERADDAETSILYCEVPYIMNKNSKPFAVRMSFDMDRVPWNISQLLVNISVEGDGEEITPEDNNVSLLLELRHIANVYIKGRSIPESNDIYTKPEGSEEFIYIDKAFEHIYTVMNDGPSPIYNLQVQFSFPSTLITGSTRTKYLEVKARKPYDVNVDDSNSGKGIEHTSPHEKYEDSSYLVLDCSLPNIECHTESFKYPKALRKNSGVTFSFNITGLFKEQGQFLNKGGVLVKSTGTIVNEYLLDRDQDDHNLPLSTSVETVLHGNIPKSEVASWIIVVAIVCGILILIGLVVILWKFGFFKRKKPPTSDEAESSEKPDEKMSGEKVDTDPLCVDNP